MSLLINPFLSFPSAGGFSPADLSGLVMWLKADAITGLADGATVQTWEDSSSANRDATQATSSARPTYKTGILNGLPVVRFDGSNDYMTFSGLSEGDFTVHMVFKRAASGADCGLLGGTDSYPQLRCGMSGADTLTSSDHLNTNTVSSSDLSPDSHAAFSAFCFRHSFSTMLFYQGLTARGSGTFSTTSVTFNTLGAFVAGTANRMNGDIAEVVYYDHAQSTDDREAVTTYLNDKYAL